MHKKPKEVKMDIKDIMYNPLIRGDGVASIGDMAAYEEILKERHEAIKKDPRYPQWVKERDELLQREEEERTKIETETSHCLEVYSILPLSDFPKKLYLYYFGSKLIGFCANSLEQARYFLTLYYKSNIDKLYNAEYLYLVKAGEAEPAPESETESELKEENLKIIDLENGLLFEQDLDE
jgi:hypothetical protein